MQDTVATGASLAAHPCMADVEGLLRATIIDRISRQSPQMRRRLEG
jgi:hypothetical protein